MSASVTTFCMKLTEILDAAYTSNTKNYLICYDLSNAKSKDYDELEGLISDEIKLIKKPADSTWLVGTNKSSGEIREILEVLVTKKSGKLFIAEINKSNYSSIP